MKIQNGIYILEASPAKTYSHIINARRTCVVNRILIFCSCGIRFSVFHHFFCVCIHRKPNFFYKKLILLVCIPFVNQLVTIIIMYFVIAFSQQCVKSGGKDSKKRSRSRIKSLRAALI